MRSASTLPGPYPPLPESRPRLRLGSTTEEEDKASGTDSYLDRGASGGLYDLLSLTGSGDLDFSRGSFFYT